jgi:hypothetical protein
MSKQQNNLDSLFFFKSLPSAFVENPESRNPCPGFPLKTCGNDIAFLFMIFSSAREIDSGEQSQGKVISNRFCIGISNEIPFQFVMLIHP